MFELWPSIKYCKRYGKSVLASPGGTSYPASGLPNTQDDTMRSQIKQSGNGASKPGASYPQSGTGLSRHPRVEGLPS